MFPSLEKGRCEQAAAASGCHVHLCSVLPTAVPWTAKQGTQSTNLEGTGTTGIALLTHLPLGAHTNVTNH